jgi:hypothetical protein
MGDAGYPDFVDFLAKMASGFGTMKRKLSRKTEDDGDMMVPA